MSQPATITRVSKGRDRRVALVAVTVLLLVIAAASLYRVLYRGESLPFRTISQSAQRGDFGVWEYGAKEPALFIVATPEEVNNVAKILLSGPPKLVDRLRAVDYQHEFVILALHGSVGSNDFSITIEQVQKRDSQITVVSSFVGPAPGELLLPGTSSPYHLIAVAKVGSWGRQVRLVLMNGLKQVAETTHFIP